MPLVFLYTPWKHLVFWCFQGVWKETSAMNWVALVKVGTFYDFRKSGIPSQVFFLGLLCEFFQSSCYLEQPWAAIPSFQRKPREFFLARGSWKLLVTKMDFLNKLVADSAFEECLLCHWKLLRSCWYLLVHIQKRN